MAFNLDKSHSEVGFGVKHMMISTVRGKFTRFDADVQLDPAHVEFAKVTARIEAASVNTNEDKRDGHLRWGDFFDADSYATLSFTSSSVHRSGARGELEGVEAGAQLIQALKRTANIDWVVAGPSFSSWSGFRCS